MKRRRVAEVLLATLAVAAAAEAAATAVAAAMFRRGDFPAAKFERLALAARLYPALTKSPWKDEFAITPRPGDLDEEWSFYQAFRPDPLLGWRPREGARVARFGFPMIVTPQGFVSVDGRQEGSISREKPAGCFRAIVLGGSTVGGIGSFPRATIPAQLRDSLAKTLGPDHVEVINAGSDSFTSSSELLYLLSELVHFHPDVVVVYDGWNEVNIANHRAALMGDRWLPLRIRDSADEPPIGDFEFHPGTLVPVFRRALGQWWRHRKQVLAESSATVQLLATITPALFPVSPAGPDPFQNDPYDPRIARAYSENLDLMGIVARNYGARIAFFLQPFMGPSPKPFTDQEKAYYSQMSPRERENRNLFGADAAKIFARLAKQSAGNRSMIAENLLEAFRDSAEQTFSYTGHLNAAGNRIIAGRIAGSLARAGWLHVPAGSHCAHQ